MQLIKAGDMADLFVHRAPRSLAVLPFYVTAALFFLGWSILLFVSAKELTGHHFNPHILAIVHAIVLGWGTMIIFGAAYQLIPVLSEQNLYSDRLAFISYLCLTTGSIVLVWSFWKFWTGTALIVGGTLVVIAASCYLYNICATITLAAKTTRYQYFLISSAIWLLITTTAGLLLAINLTTNFIPRNHLEMLKLHAHAGIIGWFLQLICGVGAKLIPMFLLGKVKNDRLLHVSLILQNLGLVLFVIHGYFKQIDLGILPYVVTIVAGILCWIWYIQYAIRTRIRKKIDLLMKQAVYSLYMKALALAALIVSWLATDTKWVSLYGIFIFLGWLTGLIISKTFKTLPFIIWNNRYKGVHGNANIPLPKNLYREQWIRIQTYLFAVAFVVLCIAIVVNQVWLIQIATALWVALATLYAVNVCTVMLHKSTVKR